MQSCVCNERFLGVRHGSERAVQETEDDIIRGDRACVFDVDRNSLEWDEVLVGRVGIAREKGRNAVCGVAGSGGKVGGKVCVVHSITKLEDRSSSVPFIGSSRFFSVVAHIQSSNNIPRIVHTVVA